MDQHLQKELDGFKLRRGIINELNFTYRKLQRLLSALVRRGEPGALGRTLQHELKEDHAINDRLVQVAMDQGQPPGPCACEEPNALVENVYHMDRTRPSNRTGAAGIVAALKRVRIFLLRAWGRLLGALPEDESAGPRKRVVELQNREAEQHRELVELEHQLEHEDEWTNHGRMRNGA